MYSYSSIHSIIATNHIQPTIIVNFYNQSAYEKNKIEWALQRGEPINLDPNKK